MNHRWGLPIGITGASDCSDLTANYYAENGTSLVIYASVSVI